MSSYEYIMSFDYIPSQILPLLMLVSKFQIDTGIKKIRPVDKGSVIAFFG